MSATFTALVGRNRKKFTLYTNVATNSSRYFKAIVRNWGEGPDKDRRVALPAVDEDIFEGYLQWLNTGNLTFTGQPSMLAMTKLYILGDFLHDQAFRGTVLDRIANLACQQNIVPGPRVATLAWTQTPPGSSLRHLYLGIWASSTCLTTVIFSLTHPGNDYPKAFLLELLL